LDRERERERERDGGKERWREIFVKRNGVELGICVCLFAREN